MVAIWMCGTGGEARLIVLAHRGRLGLHPASGRGQLEERADLGVRPRDGVAQVAVQADAHVGGRFE
jgi:hypothetical protein